MDSTKRTRELVFDAVAADEAMSRLEEYDCDTIVSLLPRMQKLAAEKISDQLRRSAATEPLYLNGMSIPSEIMLHVFKLLDLESLMECRLVCRLFHSLVRDSRLWTSLPRATYIGGGRLAKRGIDLFETIEFVSRYPKLRDWTVPSGLDFGRVPVDAMDALALAVPDTQRWHSFNNQTLTREHVARLLIGWPYLRSLSVVSAALPVDLASLTHLSVRAYDMFDGRLPVIQSKSLRHLDYFGVGIHGTINNLLNKCPNLETLSSALTLDEALVSDGLRSLKVYFVRVNDAISACSALTDFEYDVIPDDEPEGNWSETVKNLRGGSQDSATEIDLQLFPSLESFFITDFKDPIYSNSLRRLDIGIFYLPYGCILSKLEWLSVKDSETDDERDTPNDKLLLKYDKCHWPRGLKTLRIQLRDKMHGSRLCTEFVKEVIADLPELRELSVNAVLDTNVYSPVLTELAVDGFQDWPNIVRTVRGSGNLRVLKLGIGQSKTGLSNAFWDDMSLSIDLAKVKIMVPLALRTKMPPAFKRMLLKGKVAYFDRSKTSSYGHYNEYFLWPQHD
ncbi:hypothetical protein SARC_11765 [Sphaeroforma arctica JP610]|uniref:F-box domain-containing protein n=1 Tax=Sphaeroforma arctica JP610 TaxID=667725 RepID=A0A0L0FI61_9EUKA|nr:hypothetical protein SARC_11765 [Sphaeroforma arctica JP610]KNC75718.1 hypothetical protein SARC_11765 [Sphaeroforma arctica JP610]|eukprot:XP_014149620.1 hypothetical protein SARC_11765 [Sphaeroforma arctica JP610]